MTEISIPEEEFTEPSLNYWKPVPKPPPVALPLHPLPLNCLGHANENLGWPYQAPTYNQPPVLPPSYAYQQSSYPLTDVIHSYIQNQQVRLSPGCPVVEGERRRLSQCSMIGAEHVLYTLSANPKFEQDNQAMTDNMIQDEVTRAAKTLFSKRNRTLLHWLNPEINKNQIKIDVNHAWENLPASEKVFYISQVLGKFSPHVTSLMVNPQLEPSNKDSSGVKSSCVDKKLDKANVSESKSSTNTKVRQRPKKTQAKQKSDAIKTEVKTEDEASCDSGLVVDAGESETPKEAESTEEKPRVKRKYTKRKRKEIVSDQNSCPLPVDVKDIKVEPADPDLPVDVKNIKLEPNTEIPVNVQDIKVEPNNKEVKNLPLQDPPRPKRKYVKRKLVRKKYKRREPKQKPPINKVVSPEPVSKEEKEPQTQQNDEEEMEMDLWIDLENDSILTNEEVDSFFESIGDPDSLFRELGIIESV